MYLGPVVCNLVISPFSSLRVAEPQSPCPPISLHLSLSLSSPSSPTRRLILSPPVNSITDSHNRLTNSPARKCQRKKEIPQHDLIAQLHQLQKRSLSKTSSPLHPPTPSTRPTTTPKAMNPRHQLVTRISMTPNPEHSQKSWRKPWGN